MLYLRHGDVIFYHEGQEEHAAKKPFAGSKKNIAVAGDVLQSGKCSDAISRPGA